MRFLIFLLFILPFTAGAQLKSFTLSKTGDTLNRVDLSGQKQGPWVERYENVRGERGYEEEGYYKDGRKEGVWRRYSLQGDLIAMENFRYGYKDGKNAYFTMQGELEREEMWRAIDPKNPYDTVNIYDPNDPTKVVGKTVVKVEPNSYKHGTWKYYDPRYGTIVSTESWVMDKPKAKPGEGPEVDDLAPIDVSTGEAAVVKKEEKKPAPKPKEVMEFEKKNAGKKKINVRTGSTGG